MKQLSRIVLVNWYLFEANEWRIDGHTALLGANGAGKSSFLDAIQYVMLGGNKKHWRPNAKAQQTQSERDVRGYVLGLIKTEAAVENHPDFQPRASALSRIVLVYTDQDTGEHISVGAALSARRDEPKEHVEGLFILHGIDLTLDDLLESVPSGGQQTLPWADLKAHFQTKVGEQDRFILPAEPEKFVAQLVRSLAGPQMIIDPKKYIRAFRQSVTRTSLDGSVSHFVRNSVLYAEPIDTDGMRRSRESYRNKKHAVELTRKQLNQLSEILKHFNAAYRHYVLEQAYRWCAEELAFESLQVEMDEKSDAMQTCREQRHDHMRTLKRLAPELQQLQLRHNEINEQLIKDEGESHRKALQLEIDQNQDQINRHQRTLRDTHALLLHTESLRHFSSLFDETVMALVDQLASSAHALDQLDLPPNPKAIDERITEAALCFDAQSGHIHDRQVRLDREIDDMAKEEAELRRRLDNLNAGQADLSRSTVLVMALLQTHGIESRPVSELVEVSDPEWQPAIEAYLGKNCEALIVDPHQAKDALRVYRQAKREQGLYRVVVVNTQSVQNTLDHPRPIKPSTAASLITGEDALAVGFLQQLLANIELHQSEDGLLSANRALSKDGMLVRKHGFERLPLPEIPRLGRQNHEKRLELLNQQLRTACDARLGLEQKSKHCGEAHALVSQLVAAYKHAPSIDDLCQQIQALRLKNDSLNQSILDLNLDRSEQLKAELEQVNARIQKNQQETIGAGTKKATAEAIHKQSAQQYRDLKADEPDIDTRRAAITQQHYFDVDRTNEVYCEQTDKHLDINRPDYKALIRRCQDSAGRHHNQANNAKSEAVQAATDYNREFNTQVLSLEFHETRHVDDLRKVVSSEHERLENTGLAEREEAASAALKEAERVIRQDLAIKLKTQIDEMKRRIDELNAELRNRPFSANQMYRFKYSRKAEYQTFLEFVEQTSIEQSADVGGLFDTAPPEKFAFLVELLETNDLVDYRDFYEFDIEIKDPETGVTELLSAKKGSGSGGEQRSPFYVAMGASLASAYRINRTSPDQLSGGISLYLADEAFQSMDDHNTRQTADYLKSIGLQLFIAGPDEAERRMTPIVDTVMFFIRHGNRAEVVVEYPTPQLKQVFDQQLDEIAQA